MGGLTPYPAPIPSDAVGEGIDYRPAYSRARLTIPGGDWKFTQLDQYVLAGRDRASERPSGGALPKQQHKRPTDAAPSTRTRRYCAAGYGRIRPSFGAAPGRR